MLYNKDWDKPKVTTDPYSLDSLIAWLEKQPADGHYNSMDSYSCMLAQWLKSIDNSNYKPITTDSFTYRAGNQIRCFRQFSKIALNYSRTFGEALTIAKEMRAQGLA